MTQTNEEWRPVVGFEGRYEVSNLGRVRSVDTRVSSGQGRTRIAKGRVFALFLGDRYAKANLKVDGKQHNSYVHRLVAAAFIGPCPDGMEVCHNNGDPFDNRVDNLRYDTHAANVADRFIHGTVPAPRRNADECYHGHPYADGSFYVDPSGKKVCLICDAARGARRRAAERQAAGRRHRSELTECKNGHPFDGHNGRQKTCSVCTKAAAKRNRQKAGTA
jgi:hypothetical protein